MTSLRDEWKQHNSLKGQRPMICVSPEGAWKEILPESSFSCENEVFRAAEYDLRSKLYWSKVLKDDTPVSEYVNIPWVTTLDTYGVEVKKDVSEVEGSFIYRHPIKDIDKDFHKLKFRKISVERYDTLKKTEAVQEAIGDILNVRIRGAHWWTLGLTSEIIKLIGLTNFMMTMYDNPNGLHKMMSFLRDEHFAYIQFLRDEGLLCLNNEDDLIASGGIGYTYELPSKDFNGKVDFKDMWGFAESQETVGISPEMFAEFVFPYQLAILKEFGLNCYGCCEPIEGRWSEVRKIPNLRRLSVSPWSNQNAMKDLLGKDYIFSRKPNPSPICASFDEEAIRKDLSLSMALSEYTNMEIILKDTHTVQNQPERLKRWVQIAREEFNQEY